MGLVPFAYMCLTWYIGALSPLSPVGGIAFSLNNSAFFPKNSLLTSNTSTVVCHSDGARPMWLNSDGTTVANQVTDDNTTQLVVTDIGQFTNGVYQCMSSAGNASLGLFIRPPGK